MRRAVVLRSAAADGASSFSRFFSKPVIADMKEMKTINTVQQLAEKASGQPVPSSLLALEGGPKTWIENSFTATPEEVPSKPHTLLSKDDFNAVLETASRELQATEDSIWTVKPAVDCMTEEEISSNQDCDAYIEALAISLARHKTKQLANCFDILDTNFDGQLKVADVEKALSKVIASTDEEWLRAMFELFDTDKDDCVSEDESRRILETIVEAQKEAMAHLFTSHVANMPKKVDKVFWKGVKEENWTSKIPEKVRCTFHFASKVEDTTPPKVQWQAFKESQEKEFPDLFDLQAVYAKGFYNDRHTFHERKQEKRSQRQTGVLLALFLGVVDYLAAVY